MISPCFQIKRSRRPTRMLKRMLEGDQFLVFSNLHQAVHSDSFRTILTNLWTNGDTRNIAGKAMIKAKAQAFSQITTISLTKPTLKTLMIKDMMHDISNDIKNEKTIRWCFGLIMKFPGGNLLATIIKLNWLGCNRLTA